MARQRSPDRLQAEQLYLEHNGNIDLVDIADKLGRTPGTIRGWKNKDKWDDKLNGTFQKKSDENTERSKSSNRNKRKEKKKSMVKNEDEETIEEVMKNDKLTDKQKLFCIHFSKSFNATKAYQKAYEVDYVTANTNGPRLLVNACIKEEIQRLKQGKLNRAFLDEDDIFQKHIDIAFADITDFIEFGTKEVAERDCDGNPVMVDGKEVTYPMNYVNFKDSRNIDGTIVSEVSKGKNGVKVKLADKMTALKWLADRMDLLATETKERFAIERSKMEVDTEEVNNREIQNFINAISLSGEEVAELFEEDEDVDNE